MKTKNAMRFHLIPVRKAKFPKPKITNVDECGMERNLEIPQKS